MCLLSQPLAHAEVLNAKCSCGYESDLGLSSREPTQTEFELGEDLIESVFVR